MEFIYTCNNCPQLNITESEQERLKLYGEIQLHLCCKYGKRLFHYDTGKNHDRNIYPCAECIADMALVKERNNNT